MRTFEVRLGLQGGETDSVHGGRDYVSPRTTGFIPDKRGFVRPLRSDRPILPIEAPHSGPAAWGGKNVWALKSFVDSFGRKRVVAVVDGDIYSVDGKTLTKLYSYDQSRLPSDKRWDGSIVEISGHLLFFHREFAPLKWNGDEPVNYVGVREVPAPPEVTAVNAYNGVSNKSFMDYYKSKVAWGTGLMPFPELQDTTIADAKARKYGYRIAYVNSRGQTGRWSAVSWIDIPPLVSKAGNDAAEALQVVLTWDRPLGLGATFDSMGEADGHGTDIVGYAIARTVDVESDQDVGAFFVAEAFIPYTQNHWTDQVSDAGLSLAITENASPPGKLHYATVFRNIVVASGDSSDPYGVWYSEPLSQFDSWPQLNYYKASDIVTNVVALSDRVCVITRSSIEVLRYDDATGVFALFTANNERGANIGRSVVAYKDALYGIFQTGFGIFDGFNFKGVPDRLGELLRYIDDDNADSSFGIVTPDGDYALFTTHRASDSVMLYSDMSSGSWFKSSYAANCAIVVDGGIIVGRGGNVHQFDSGDALADTGAMLDIGPITLVEMSNYVPALCKKINNVFYVIGSGSSIASQVDVVVDEQLWAVQSTGKLPTRGENPPNQDSRLGSAWGVSLWDDPTSAWENPKFSTVRVRDFTEDVHGYTFRLSLRPMSYVEVAGVLIEFDVMPIGHGP